MPYAAGHRAEACPGERALDLELVALGLGHDARGEPLELVGGDPVRSGLDLRAF